MNDPIISPWLIYLLFMLDKWQVLVVIGGTLLSFATIVSWIFSMGDYPEEVAIKLRKPITIITIVVGMFAVFIPTRDTVIAMIVADNITPNNLGIAKDTAVDIKDSLKKDVIDIIDSINKENTSAD